MSDQIELLLKSLRLPTFVQHYQRLLDEANEQHWSYLDYLRALCEYELSDRYQRRVRNWTREAQLPEGKTFASLQFGDLTKKDRQPVKQLMQNREWWHRSENVVLIGASGVGKSHIAASLGHQLIEQNVRCKMFPAVALVQELQKAKENLELMIYMTRLDKYRVVIIDDIGYVKKTDAETQVLFEFIAHRYESGSLVITANQPFSEWDSIFPDNIMTVAAVDRLVHHATIIKLDGDSFRRKEQQSKKSTKQNRPS